MPNNISEFLEKTKEVFIRAFIRINTGVYANWQINISFVSEKRKGHLLEQG